MQIIQVAVCPVVQMKQQHNLWHDICLILALSVKLFETLDGMSMLDVAEGGMSEIQKL